MYDEYTTFLGIPGPVEIHPRVYSAMNRHTYGHRTDHFVKIYTSCVDKFKQTINTQRTPQFHAGSGSLGLHAAITNLVSPDDHVLNLINGKFGERVEKITKRFTKNSHFLAVEYGKGISPEMVKKALEDYPDTSLVTITHNETSTGILNPLSEISKVVHNHGALLMADCITSAGGDLVEMDKWKIDFFVSGSQKCYGLPPGLAFIVFSEAAEEKMQKVSRNQDFYTDLLNFSQQSLGKTPFTPAVNMIYGLNESLSIILEEGMDNRIKRHRLIGQLYRDGLEALGIELFAQEGYRSNTVTTAKIPKGIDGKKFVNIPLEFGVMLAGGQGTMAGKIFRFGHMNLVGPRELLMVMSVLELSLKKAGVNIELGAGIRTIQQKLI